MEVPRLVSYRRTELHTAIAVENARIYLRIDLFFFFVSVRSASYFDMRKLSLIPVFSHKTHVPEKQPGQAPSRSRVRFLPHQLSSVLSEALLALVAVEDFLDSLQCEPIIEIGQHIETFEKTLGEPVFGSAEAGRP